MTFTRVLRRLEGVARDARVGARLLRRSGFVAAAAIASLALALGASIAAFALVEALILRPLPVAEPQRLVHLTVPGDNPNAESEASRDPLFGALRDAARGQADLFAMSTQVVRRTVIDPASAEREETRTLYLSGDAFARLGIAAAAGRTILPSDDERGAAP